jgi:hypothetical protein
MIWSSLAGCTFCSEIPTKNHQQLDSVILGHNNVVANRRRNSKCVADRGAFHVLERKHVTPKNFEAACVNTFITVYSRPRTGR